MPKTSKSHSSKKSEKSSGHKKGGDSSNSADSPTGPLLSFLFVVNEVDVLYKETDEWGNPRPPSHMQGYANEVPSPVMRYREGRPIEVVESDRCYWERDEKSNQGRICFPGREGTTGNATIYKTSTICTCHPLMPFAMAMVDVMVEPTMTADRGGGNEPGCWQPLLFYWHLNERGDDVTGQSQAIFRFNLCSDHTGADPEPLVAGKSPSWLPYLVPKSYENVDATKRSAGLGGDLTALLGIMTFTAARLGRTNRAKGVFVGPNGRWRNRKWYHHHSPAGHNRSVLDLPQALIITIAVDPWNEEGSSTWALDDFEFGDVAVQG